MMMWSEPLQGRSAVSPLAFMSQIHVGVASLLSLSY